MRKKILIIGPTIFFSILIIFLYLLTIDRNPSSIPSALISKKAPEFKSISLLTNKTFISSKELAKNEMMIVNFFATWCKPCKDEHPFIDLISKENKKKVIGINYKDDSKKTIKWLKKLGNPYYDVIEDKNGTIGIDWGVYGIPETFIINAEGIIIYRHVGPINKKIYKKINLIIKENK
tara:strand:+ start:222 stop:755 length:534 start_codon:yes stop_codon:yes gene_type:complete